MKPAAAPRAPDLDSGVPHAHGGAAGHVRKLARASNSNFFYAFLTLPRARREAIYALYSFCHAVDEAVDAAPDGAAADARLAAWRVELDAMYRGQPRHPVAQQLAVAAARFDLPRAYLEQVIEGVAMDLVPQRFATWDQLARYCDLVASAVGRLAVRIFGAQGPRAEEYASALGTALQLTNILRDLGPDAAAGRFYLPQEDLARFGVDEAGILGDDPRRAALLHFEAERARTYYAEARLLSRGSERLLFAAEIMGAIYRRLLETVERRGFPTAEDVVRLPRSLKGWIAGTTWLRCRIAPRGPVTERT